MGHKAPSRVGWEGNGLVIKAYRGQPSPGSQRFSFFSRELWETPMLHPWKQSSWCLVPGCKGLSAEQSSASILTSWEEENSLPKNDVLHTANKRGIGAHTQKFTANEVSFLRSGRCISWLLNSYFHALLYSSFKLSEMLLKTVEGGAKSCVT